MKALIFSLLVTSSAFAAGHSIFLGTYVADPQNCEMRELLVHHVTITEAKSSNATGNSLYVTAHGPSDYVADQIHLGSGERIDVGGDYDIIRWTTVMTNPRKLVHTRTYADHNTPNTPYETASKVLEVLGHGKIKFTSTGSYSDSCILQK